jgi:hypothetical protein
MALCLLALAFTLLPSKATRPNFSAPISNTRRNICQRFQMKFPKIGYGAEIRLIAGGQYAESHVFRETLLNPPRGKH